MTHTEDDRWQQARSELAKEGQTTVRGLVSAQKVAHWRDLVRDATTQMEKLVLPVGNEVYQQAFEQYMNLWQFDSRCEEIALDADIGQAAARLLDVEHVRLYHDQALVKTAGGGRTPWHQDQWYWPLSTQATITMWLALHDISADMGELEFALDTHHAPISATDGDAPISTAGEDFYGDWLAHRDVTRRRTGDMRAGDASFHLGWTLHRAEPNRTEVDREVMTVIWFADGATLVEPTSAEQRTDMAQWLPGVEVGQRVASSLNPVVGSRKNL